MSVAVVFMFPDDPHTSSIVLSAFYWGYAISQIPGGALVGRFGGQCVLACAVLAWSVATFATTPFGLLSVVANATASGESSASASAHPPLLGFIGLCLCRAVVGVAEGWNYPSQVGLISRWIPVEERSRAWAFLSCGEQLGTIIALLFCPAMAVKLGWSSIFWFSGVVGVVWAVAFVALSASTPARHRCIGSEERAMIERSRPDPATTTSRISGGANVKASRRVPWCRFLRNGPFIALMITHFCYNWCVVYRKEALAFSSLALRVSLSRSPSRPASRGSVCSLSLSLSLCSLSLCVPRFAHECMQGLLCRALVDPVVLFEQIRARLLKNGNLFCAPVHRLGTDDQPRRVRRRLL